MPQINYFRCENSVLSWQKLFAILFVFVPTLTTYCQALNVDTGEPIYLTPLIKDGKIKQAMEAALVPEFYPIISYSGLITMNEEHNSNIFFWYFPAEESYDDYYNNNIEVILWNDGGPGVSCMMSVFGQNGPFLGNPKGDNYTINPFSWHERYHMIYIDNPVQVGFSFTDSDEGFVTSSPDAARDIYEFLTQFFALFTHLRRNPFYNAGVSYGGTYAVQTAYYIHNQNLGTPNVYINLTGLILDSPWIDSFSQSDYADQLHSFGLIGENSRVMLKTKEDHLQSLLAQEKYLDAMMVWVEITQSLTLNLTGYPALNNIYNDQPAIVNMTEYIIQNSTRKALHVGSLNFTFFSFDQQTRMHPNFMRSSKPQLDILLQAGYQLLLYLGNLDILTGHKGIEKMFNSMDWEGAKDLANERKSILLDDKQVSGYRTRVNDSTEYVILRNTGHGCLLEWVFDALQDFLGSKNNTDTRIN